MGYLRRVSGRAAVAALASVGLLVLAGCGSEGPKTLPVNGKVVFSDGTPFPGGVVEFESLSPEGKSKRGLPLNARAAIQPDGTFRLTTFETFDGAVAGKHRALVRAPRAEFSPMKGERPPPPIVDPKFERYETSGIEVEITEGTNELTITVERPPAGRR